MIIIPAMTMIILPNMMHPKILHNTLRKTKNMNKAKLESAALSFPAWFTMECILAPIAKAGIPPIVKKNASSSESLMEAVLLTRYDAEPETATINTERRRIMPAIFSGTLRAYLLIIDFC
jgi:hypothetical protein